VMKMQQVPVTNIGENITIGNDKGFFRRGTQE
jgi:hypothetical protein